MEVSGAMTSSGQWAVSKSEVCCFCTEHIRPVRDYVVVSFPAKSVIYVPLRVWGPGWLYREPHASLSMYSHLDMRCEQENFLAGAKLLRFQSCYYIIIQTILINTMFSHIENSLDNLISNDDNNFSLYVHLKFYLVTPLLLGTYLFHTFSFCFEIAQLWKLSSAYLMYSHEKFL